MSSRTSRGFVDVLPQILKERGMSQRALAQLVGVSPTYLSKVLRRADYKTPSPELARRVALALDFPPDYFPEYREGVVIAEVKRSHDLRDRLYDELSRD